MKKSLICLLSVVLLTGTGYAVEADEPYIDSLFPEKIIGSDDRKLITNTTDEINRTMVRITFETYNEYGNWGKFCGSGVLIGNDTVLTAGHVLYNQKYGQYTQNLKVVPAATWNGESFLAPYGYSVATETEVLSGYKSGDTAQDVGVIKLKTPLGSKTGFLTLSESVSSGQYVKTIGYPGDKNGLYFSEGSVLSSDGIRVKYNLDTMGGQSGSPILNDTNQIIAVHYGGMKYEESNIAYPINNSVRQLISEVNSTSGAVYRVYNPNSGKHHYTSSVGEKNYLVKLGWRDEGIAWEAGSHTPVYRLYNPNNGLHFFTASEAEKNSLVKLGWRDEGIAFYGGDNLDVFRLYNRNSGEHFYTVDYLERDSLVSKGWRYEGVAFKTK